MWNGSYWGARFFAPRYWCKTGGSATAILFRRPNTYRTGSRPWK